MAKRANGEGNIKKRKDGSWEARLTVGDKRRSVYGKTQAEVVGKLKALKSARDDGIDIDAGKMTLSEWMDVWMSEYRNGIKVSTRAVYSQTLKLYITPYIGKIKLENLTGTALQKMYNAEINKGLSAKTVKNVHGVLHKALEQARVLGYITKNPCDSCELPSVFKKEMCPLVDDVLAKFLNAIKNDEYGSIMFVALFTGLRESEIIGLTWDCIDFNKKKIRIYRQLSKPRGSNSTEPYVFTRPKNNKERMFSAVDSVFEVLRDVKTRQEQWRIKCGSAWLNSEDFVFTNELGKHYATQTVYKRFKKIAKSVGSEQSRFHDLRHTYATLSIAAGVDIKTISTALGHATVAFTMDIYGHVYNKMQEDNAAKLQKYVSDML